MPHVFNSCVMNIISTLLNVLKGGSVQSICKDNMGIFRNLRVCILKNGLLAELGKSKWYGFGLTFQVVPVLCIWEEKSWDSPTCKALLETSPSDTSVHPDLL